MFFWFITFVVYLWDLCSENFWSSIPHLPSLSLSLLLMSCGFSRQWTVGWHRHAPPEYWLAPISSYCAQLVGWTVSQSLSLFSDKLLHHRDISPVQWSSPHWASSHGNSAPRRPPPALGKWWCWSWSWSCFSYLSSPSAKVDNFTEHTDTQKIFRFVNSEICLWIWIGIKKTFLGKTFFHEN